MGNAQAYFVLCPQEPKEGTRAIKNVGICNDVPLTVRLYYVSGVMIDTPSV